MQIDYIEQSTLEHRFWLQIMGDHARLIHNGFVPLETEAIEMAREYITEFDRLLASSRMNLDNDGWMSLAQQALPAVQSQRDFKLELLRRRLYKQKKSNKLDCLY